MIDIISGKVVVEGENYLVIMLGGQIGLRVYTTRAARQQVDSTNNVTLHTYLIVREDDLTLYGFASEDERELFRILLGISGISPRLAVMTLSTLSREQLHNAVASEEPALLTRVPGIGKKTAQKVIFELKDKLRYTLADQLAPINEVDTDVIATLTALGYSIVEAQAALQSIPADAPMEVEERVRLALQYFA